MERTRCAATKTLDLWRSVNEADVAIFDVEDYREIPYYFGVNKCWMTIKNGEIVHGGSPYRM